MKQRHICTIRNEIAGDVEDVEVIEIGHRAAMMLKANESDIVFEGEAVLALMAACTDFFKGLLEEEGWAREVPREPGWYWAWGSLWGSACEHHPMRVRVNDDGVLTCVAHGGFLSKEDLEGLVFSVAQLPYAPQRKEGGNTDGSVQQA